MAETLPPPSITVPTQSNDTEQPSIWPTVPESKETAKTDEINQVFQDQTRTKKLEKLLDSEPKCASTLVRHTSYNNELDDTKLLLNTQLTKLQDAASEVEKQELLYQFAMEAASSFRKSGKSAPVPSSVASKDDYDEHGYKPFLKKPISTLVPNYVKGDAPLLGSDIHTKLRQEAALNTASQLGGLTNNNGFSTVQAQDLEYTNISKHRNSRGGKSNNNGDGRQQLSGFPSQNSPITHLTPLGCLKDQRKVTRFWIRVETGGSSTSHQKA